MKKLSFLILLFFISAIAAFGQKLTPKEKIVFDEIAYHRFRTGEYEKIHKWVVPIRYKVIGDSSKYILNEIDTTFSELARLTNLDIQKSDDDDEVNFIIALRNDVETIAQLSEHAKRYANTTGGFAYKANKKSEIYRLERVFAISKYRNKADVRYAVKKGIIGGFGLFKKSENAPKSLFYEANNGKLKIDAFDSAIITAFYNENIKAGMTKEEVDPLLQ
ncbi:DUF2927 domain-containing protein [Pedobacter xixiisoli]|uniref:DUF2927 domain-containing protein n=1 Tax=Pedobacter xixiisoli TaxID=1476464 RepID=A0A285ZNB5_9SPHI|nr:DUF2927 domain-containing protein [Pedobacter xixiisoli]SOD11149.1 Protein of unknown function [Pedobacter xixiisoli]